jgi:adenylosuccinate lyase
MSMHATYQSPYSWRYGSDAMRRVWSEEHKRELWRQLWVWLAEVQVNYGLATGEQVERLRSAVSRVDVARSLEIEEKIKHDLMAELKVFADQTAEAGGILHLGATSMDIKDNAVVLQIREASLVIRDRLSRVLDLLADKIERHADLPILAFTHLQPAEPTTLGYRLAYYAQDLLESYREVSDLVDNLRAKGFTGAVGTSASFRELIGEEQLPEFQGRLADKMGLDFYPVVSQTYPRSQDYRVLNSLAGIGAVLYKFAFDLRLLQNPLHGEWAEGFGAEQVGSSAMPFKRNPILAEKMDSLGRLIAQLPRVAWDNAAHSLLERTLDDSANRRTVLPEAFLIADEMLLAGGKILESLRIDPERMEHNLAQFGPFAAVERVLMALGRAGADRQEMHENLRVHSLQAWEAIQAGHPNPLEDSLAADPEITRYLTPEELQDLLVIDDYHGDAPARARKLAASVRREVQVPGETLG